MTVPLHHIGQILSEIYDTEVPIRLEYIWDGGWTWAIVGSNGDDARTFPRVWFDDQIDGCHRLVCVGEHARQQLETIPVQEKDWLARGCADTIGEAVEELCCELARLIPESQFAARWNSGVWI